MDQSTANLLAELNDLFAPEKPKKSRLGGPTSSPRKPIVKAESEGAIATRLARKLTPDYRPVAHVTLLQAQSCRCCGGTVRAVGGEFTRYESPARHTRIQRHFDPTLHLPHLVERATVTVERCAECLLLDGEIDEIISCLDHASRQKSLFA